MEESSHKKKRGEGKGTVADIEDGSDSDADDVRFGPLGMGIRHWGSPEHGDSDEDPDEQPLIPSVLGLLGAKGNGKAKGKDNGKGKGKANRERQMANGAATANAAKAKGKGAAKAKPKAKARQQALALSQQLLDLQLLDQADRRLDTMYGPRGGGGGGKGAGPGGGGKVAKGQGSMDQIICQAAKGNMKGGKETMDEIHNGCYLNYTPHVHKGQPCGPPPGTPMPNVDPMEIEPVFHNPMWKLVERRKHEANTPPQGTPDTRYDDYWDTMVNDTQDRNYGHFMTAFYKGKHKGRLIGHY